MKEKLEQVDNHFKEEKITKDTRDFLFEHWPQVKPPTEEELKRFREQAIAIYGLSNR